MTIHGKTLFFIFLCSVLISENIFSENISIPQEWEAQDIYGKKFLFHHGWKTSDKYQETRNLANKKFGFIAPDIVFSYVIDMTGKDKINKELYREIEGCPRILWEPTISRYGGYGKAMSIEESRKKIPSREEYEKFKQELGGPLIGICASEWMDCALKNGHKKDFPQDNVFAFPAYPTNKKEAVKRLEKYYKNGLSDFVYGDIVSVEGYRLFHHHAYEWGAKVCIAEIGENIPATQIQIAFTRGAARQYAKPWGVWVADFYGGSHRYYPGANRVINEKEYAPTLGHTESIQKRFLYMSFMSGSNMNAIECVNFLTGGYYKDDNSDGILELTPWGDLAKEMIKFGRLHAIDRGITITPVGIMVEWAHGWSPAGCTPHKIWGCLEFQKADRMMDEIFNLFFPWKPSGEFGYNKITPPQTEHEYLANNEFGDIFDVITDNAKNTILATYPIILLAGDVQVRADLEKRLWNYVNNGGILIANIEQMTSSKMNWNIETAENLETDSAVSSQICIKEDKILYKKAVLKNGMEAIFSSKDGHPLLIKQNRGKGSIYISMVPYLLNTKGHPVAHLSSFLKKISSEMCPLKINGNIEAIYNKNKTGWVITLINNNGIDKKPNTAGPGIVDYAQKQTLQITYEGKPIEIREWLENRSIWWKQEKNHAILQEIEILPGNIKIIEIKDK